MVSVFANAFMMRSFLKIMEKLAASVRQADVKTIASIHTMITTLQTKFEGEVGADLPGTVSSWAFANADKLHDCTPHPQPLTPSNWRVLSAPLRRAADMKSLANAIRVASIVACTLALLFYVLAWVSMLLDFRARVLQGRRGIWSFNVAKIKPKMTFTYFGAQISNGLMTFVLISFLLFPVVLLLAWSLTWDVLIWFIKTYYEQLILFIAPILVNIVVKKVVTKHIGPKTVIKRRFAWMFYDLYELLLSCVTGITKALVRFALVIVVTLFSLPRMDVSIFPAWLDYYIALDSGARAYRTPHSPTTAPDAFEPAFTAPVRRAADSLIVSYHQHNNPLLRVFVWTIQEDAARRRNEEECMCSPEYRRAGNLFNKLWMMHKNRMLSAYTASGSMVPLEAVVKAAKKKDPTLLLAELKAINLEPEPAGKKGGCLGGMKKKKRTTVAPKEQLDLELKHASPPPSPPSPPSPAALPALASLLEAAGLGHRVAAFAGEEYTLEHALGALAAGDAALMSDLRALGLPLGECRQLVSCLRGEVQPPGLV